MTKKYLILLAAVLLLALGTASVSLAQDGKPPDYPVSQDVDSTVATVASAPEAVWPGPDGFGYAGELLPFNWVDITTSGTLVTGWTNRDDGYAGPFPIGFTFNFYGTAWDQFYTGSNGFISFGAGSTSLSNQCPLPNASTPNDIIPLLWDDLNLNVSGDAYYQTFATCPVGTGQCVVIEYYNAAHYGGAIGSAGTWEAILYDNGDVVLQFLDAGLEEGSSSTTGMENNDAASDYGLTYACNAAATITDGLSLGIYIPIAPNLSDSHKEAPHKVELGNPIHYRVVAENTGNAPALDAWMEDVIPAGSAYVDGSVTCDAGDCYYDAGADLIRWDGVLDVQGEANIEFDVQPEACGSEIVNTAVISDPAAIAPAITDVSTFVVGDFYYTEDFEASDGGYVSVGLNPWTWGPPPQGSLPWSTNAWATEMPYVPDSDYQLISPWLDLSGVNPLAPLMIQWWQYLYIESATYDHAIVEITNDEVNWTVLWQHTGGTYNSNGWETRGADISAFIGQQVRLRFRMDSDGSVQYNGWAIDDIVIHSGCVPPDIEVIPPSLSASQLPDTITTQPLQICNNGELPLDWMLVETDSFIENSPTAILWDNGPLVTHPGGGFGGADASALQTALGLTIYGFGDQFSVGNRMADDFTITDPGGWTIDQLTFYAYQTNAPTSPSPIAGVYFQIWNGPPNDPGSAVVFGDLVTNRLLTSTWVNMYRVLDTNLTDTARAVFANVASAGVTLLPGTYWIDWTIDGNPSYSGPWAPPISILGQTTTGDALQYTGAWAPALDVTYPQGMPFVVEGIVNPVVDIPWLSEAPTSGTVAPASCQLVDVTFDSTGLMAGEYLAGLDVYNSDPDENPTHVPVSLLVEGLAPNLSTSQKFAPASVLEGDPIHYTIAITNTGNTDALSVLMADAIPAGTTFNGGLTCSSGNCYYDAGSNTVFWEGEVGAGNLPLAGVPALTWRPPKMPPQGEPKSTLDFASPDVALDEVVSTPPVVQQDLILNQLPTNAGGVFSDSGCDLCGGAQVLAENFILNTTETVAQIVLWSGYYPGDVPIDPDQITVIFHQDAAGLPGPAVYTESNVAYNRVQTGVIVSGVHEYLHTLTLAAPVELSPGIYWVEIYNATGFGTDDFFWEVGFPDTVGNGLPDSAYAFEAPGVNWNYPSGYEYAIQLLGPSEQCQVQNIFYDDFEAGYGNWIMTGLWNPENEADACGALVAPFPSSSNDSYFGIDGLCTYNTGITETGSLEMTFDLDLSTAVTATLNFGSYEATECEGNCMYDNRYVEVSTDGGLTWNTVGEGDTEGVWYQPSFDLSPYVGGSLRARFFFDSYDDVANDYFGWMVDNVEVQACVPPQAYENPVFIDFDVLPEACDYTVYNEAVITDPMIPSPVTVDASTDVVCVGEPDIVVEAPPLEATLPPDATTTITFTISNVGGDVLDWSLAEVEGMEVNAQKINTVLWDNGPLVTHPGGGNGGADASALQTALGLTIYGFGDQFSVGNRMADDFTIDDPAGWTIDQITFFGYQTGAPTSPSPIAGLYYQIWDGSPDDPGSTVVFGDLTTNRLVSSSWANMYRVLDTNLTDTARAVFTNVASAGVVLPPGTYWLDWTTDGNPAYSGPWAPPISILGQTTTGNALQYTGAWAPALDVTYQQGMPFIIEGPGGYEIPWLSEDPTEGSLMPGETVIVEVTFDSTGLAPDIYTGGLEITSNDPDEPLISLPVTLTVIEIGEPDIEVDPLALEAILPIDGTTTEPLTISNVGELPLDWLIFEAGWYENFDSYAPGSQMHGQGGWKGWYNNPDAGALVSDLYAHSTPNSVEIVDDSDLVHEYAGYDSGTWTYTAWQYLPEEYSGETYFIMLNTYNDQGIGTNWSIQVKFSSISGLVENDGVTGGTLPLIVGEWVELRVEIDLDNDIQAFYYDDQLLYQGTWTNEQNMNGVLNIAAVDLWSNFASEVYYDDISLVGECGNPAEIPWLSATPYNGTIDPGLFTLVDVGFDATGMATGEYTADLCVASNDPDEPVVTVPVTMTVVAPVVELNKTVGTEEGVCAETDAIEVVAGTEVFYCYTVENVGDSTLYYHTLNDSALGVLFVDMEYELGVGESYSYIHSAVPITESVVNTGTWDAYLELGGAYVSAVDTASVTVLPPVEEADLSVDKDGPVMVYVGEDITYQLTVANDGPADATGVTLVDILPVDATFVSASAGCVEAEGIVTCDIGDLAAGASVEITIVVTAPAAPDTLTNDAEVSGDQPDPLLDNNTDSFDTVVEEVPVEYYQYYLPLIFKP